MSHEAYASTIQSPPPPKCDDNDSFANQESTAVIQTTFAAAVEGWQSPSLAERNGNKEQSCPFVRSVSKDEYDAAARIIHLQVSLEEIVSAVDALNDAIRQAVGSMQIAHVHVAESEAHLIFQSFGFDDDRKRKSLLFALCNFHCLLTRQPDNSSNNCVKDDTIFDVVGV